MDLFQDLHTLSLQAMSGENSYCYNGQDGVQAALIQQTSSDGSPPAKDGLQRVHARAVCHNLNIYIRRTLPKDRLLREINLATVWKPYGEHDWRSNRCEK